MMNVVALCLVLTTLTTAVWSPAQQEAKIIKEDIIVKEGHRTVVVEYEKDDGNTKVSISPQGAHEGLQKSSKNDENGKHDSTVEHAKEKLEDESGHKVTPRELICDAFGKCKHKIASAIGKTKDMVSEKVHEATDMVYEVEEEAKETVTDALGKVKDTVARKASEVSNKAKDTTDEASDKATEAKERVKNAASDIAKEAKQRVKDAASVVSDKAKEIVAEKANGVEKGVKETVDTAKTLQGDTKRNASMKIEATKAKASEKVKEAEENIGGVSEEIEERVQRAKEKGKKDLEEIIGRGLEVAYDVSGYFFSPESTASVMGIFQLLGLAIAYGMSFWVTFISSYILAGALPRQQFAILQSKIYTVYFKAMAYSVGTVLAGHLFSQRKTMSSGSGAMVQGFNLFASLLSVLFNLRYLEPRATKVMFERMKLEKEEGRGILETSTEEQSARVYNSVGESLGAKVSSSPTTENPSSTPLEKPNDAAAKSEMVRLSQTLKKLNSYSSFLNVLTLMALTWHLVHLGQGLHTLC
ncbi:hypothetical protein ACH5RR_033682 [Cinchona calisaya]|uniref:TMEM205-like domain-containing protein n=1 Tax=Cinchona calisaya TaxID=153742 RepID=A0ABD2Y8P2_9GENT